MTAFLGSPMSFGNASGWAMPTVTQTMISYCTFWRLLLPKRRWPIHGSFRR